MHALLIATANSHKLDEFRAIFSDLPYQLLSLNDVQLSMNVEETGITFQENSELKALAYACASGLLSLADDSGLEIDALGGAPGIYSARFRLIFERLRGLPLEQRTARFRCVITIAEPSGYHRSVEGIIEGLITEAPRGENGFGYDPIFLVPELGKTTAEISPEHKNRISHRGQAARHARVLLGDWPRLSSSLE